MSDDVLNSERTNKRIPVLRKYVAGDKAPFIVHIYSDVADSVRPAHPLHVSRIIMGMVRDDDYLIEIKKLGKGKVLAEFATAEAANVILTSQSLAAHNLRAHSLHPAV